MAPAARPRAEPGWRAWAGLGLALLLAACAAPDCEGLRGERALQATLFLGRSVAGRAPVSRAEWEEFAETVVTPRFPEGFTVLEGRGQWRNPATGSLAREETVILLLAAAQAPETLRRLDEIAAEWRRRFRQQSVGIVTAPACAAF
jgi:hypothetical protein